MTQEQKELLLKDLCARLPYKVKGLYCSTVMSLHMVNPFDNYHPLYCVTKSGSEYIGIDEFKPYLFPLSSMTLEQRCKVQSLLPDKCTISFKNSEFEFYGEDYHTIKLEQFEKLFNLFNTWHLDYRGLIPMGLANDATGLNIY